MIKFIKENITGITGAVIFVGLFVLVTQIKQLQNLSQQDILNQLSLTESTAIASTKTSTNLSTNKTQEKTAVSSPRKSAKSTVVKKTDVTTSTPPTTTSTTTDNNPQKPLVGDDQGDYDD